MVCATRCAAPTYFCKVGSSSARCLSTQEKKGMYHEAQSYMASSHTVRRMCLAHRRRSPPAGKGPRFRHGGHLQHVHQHRFNRVLRQGHRGRRPDRLLLRPVPRGTRRDRRYRAGRVCEAEYFVSVPCNIVGIEGFDTAMSLLCHCR